MGTTRQNSLRKFAILGPNSRGHVRIMCCLRFVWHVTQRFPVKNAWQARRTSLILWRRLTKNLIIVVSVSLEEKNSPTTTSSQLRMRSWLAYVAQSTAANTSINSPLFPQIFQHRSFCEIKFYLWAKCTIIRCKIFVCGLCKNIQSVTSLYLPFSLFVWDTFCMLHDVYSRFVFLERS